MYMKSMSFRVSEYIYVHTLCFVFVLTYNYGCFVMNKSSINQQACKLEYACPFSILLILKVTKRKEILSLRYSQDSCEF